MTKQVANSTRLKRVGWRVKGSGKSALYNQPGTDRWYKESHAMIVLQQMEAVEDFAKAAQAFASTWEKYMAEVLTVFQPTIDDLFPPLPKGHSRLKTCSFKFGCSVHTQIIYNEKKKVFQHIKEIK